MGQWEFQVGVLAAAGRSATTCGSPGGCSSASPRISASTPPSSPSRSWATGTAPAPTPTSPPRPCARRVAGTPSSPAARPREAGRRAHRRLRRRHREPADRRPRDRPLEQVQLRHLRPRRIDPHPVGGGQGQEGLARRPSAQRQHGSLQVTAPWWRRSAATLRGLTGHPAPEPGRPPRSAPVVPSPPAKRTEPDPHGSGPVRTYGSPSTGPPTEPATMAPSNPRPSPRPPRRPGGIRPDEESSRVRPRGRSRNAASGSCSCGSPTSWAPRVLHHAGRAGERPGRGDDLRRVGHRRLQPGPGERRPGPSRRQHLPAAPLARHGRRSRGEAPEAQVARVFCDIVNLDGSPFQGCPRHVLRRTSSGPRTGASPSTPPRRSSTSTSPTPTPRTRRGPRPRVLLRAHRGRPGQ